MASAKVNGADLNLMVDTGASNSAIYLSGLIKAHIAVPEVPAGRATSDFKVIGKRLKTDFEIAGITVHGKTFIYHRGFADSKLETNYEGGADGILGMDFFGEAPTEFAFGAAKIIVFAQECDPIESIQKDILWHPHKLLKKPYLEITTELDGRPMDSAIDSGASFNYSTAQALNGSDITLRDLKMETKKPQNMAFYGLDDLPIYPHVFNRLSLGWFSIEYPKISVWEGRLPFDIGLGLDTLDNLNLFLDPRESIVYISKVEPGAFAIPLPNDADISK